jgi:dipeptidyl aminopeptidase/acylaminoacyl peptidase
MPLSQATKLIPREVLFGNPVKANPQISPDGKRIATLAPVNNVLNVWVKTIGMNDDRAVTRDTVRGIRFCFWAKDSRHVLYLQDANGDENWRLYAVDLDTNKTRDYTPFQHVQAQVIDMSKRFPNELLIAMNEENPSLHDVYHLDLLTGKLKRVAKNPGNFSEWLADDNFKIRAAVATRPDAGKDLLIRDGEESEWRVLVTWSADDAMGSGPISFTKQGDAIYMQDSRDSDTSRLVKMQIRTGEIDVIAEDPRYDLGQVIMHPDTREVQMVSFAKARNEWVILDESVRENIDAICALHKGDFFPASRDDSDRHWVIGYNVDDGPTVYYAFDRGTEKAEFLFENRPDLKKYALSSMKPVSFTSRDGLKIEGYITFPPGAVRKNLPMVLNVHGGPWVRDGWGYDPEAQWLANRGYICLQVNYRGSSGYGKKFINAGDKEWGGKMHDDLVDAVRWAVQNGFADPKKIAIFGGSYGGYAALVGATFTPDLFCCAVDIVGPSNLLTFIRSIPPYWSVYLAHLYKSVGNPDTEENFLKSRSPLFKVDQIKIPMLIAQGANDPRVKQHESEQIVAAMKEKAIDHEYLLFPDEGHGFARPENRLKFYASCERFLAKHLGGLAE